MKPSKKKIIRIIEDFSKKYLGNYIHLTILFIRYFNKFKRSINREKTINKFSNNLDYINQFEYKITSQNNEDGIIEYIFSKIPNNKIFVEIGFSFYENNTLNLIKNGWNGTLIDLHTKENILYKRFVNFFFPKSVVKVLTEKITKDNINLILEKKLNVSEVDFFSLDVDGNDYWIIEKMSLQNFKCICIEYNHWIGNEVKKSIPYDEKFKFQDNGFFGASLLAFHDLLKKKEFDLVAIDSSGTNAFFVNKKYSIFFEILDPVKSFKSSPYLYSDEKKREIKSKIKTHNFIDV